MRNKSIFAIFVCVLLFASCRTTKEIPPDVIDVVSVKEIRDTLIWHDTSFVDRVHYVETKGDSIIVHDSVYLYIEKTKYATRYDSIQLPPKVITKTETKVVEKVSWKAVFCISLILFLVSFFCVFAKKRA